MQQRIKHHLQTAIQDKNFRVIAPIIIGAIILITLAIVLTPKHMSPQNTVSAYDKLPKANPQAMGNMKGMQMSNQLSLTATFAATAMQVTNTDTQDLHKCSLAVNAGMVQSGYTLQLATLPPNTPITVQYAQLMHYGIHFDPNKLKVHDLVVMCDDGEKSGWKYIQNK